MLIKNMLIKKNMYHGKEITAKSRAKIKINNNN